MKTKAEMEQEIKGTMSSVWDYIGSDVLQMIQEQDGKNYAKRAEVIEMVIDADRTASKLKGETLKYYNSLPYEKLVKLGKEAFPYAKYGC